MPRKHGQPPTSSAALNGPASHRHAERRRSDPESPEEWKPELIVCQRLRHAGSGRRLGDVGVLSTRTPAVGRMPMHGGRAGRGCLGH